MDYSLLTEQQLQKRYYSLSRKIRDVLDSENNLKIIHQICRAHQLNNDEKILIVKQLVCLILLGFVSMDDLSQEISENIHLNHRHSDDIASEIDRKIFTSIRSEIEKVYSPVSENEGEAEEIRPITNDLRPTTKIAEKLETEKSIPIEIRKPEPFMVSKVEPPIRIIDDLRPITEVAEGPLVVSETEPMIIHEETELKPLSESKKSFKSLGGLFGFLSASRRNKKKEEKPSPVRAEVEGIEPMKIKVVDYTEAPEALTDDQRPTTDDKPLTASEPEPPIKIIDSIRGTPEFIEIVEADKRRIREATDDQRPTTDDKLI